MVAIDDQGLTELEQFRKSLPESDGKGHYWDSAIQGWRNNDGSLYDPQWQNKQVSNDPFFGNFDAGAAENLGSTQSQKPNFTPPAPSYSLSTPALGQFNVANPDMNGDGLDDSTGFAVGVVRDSGSPSGYSYNGTPVTTNGAPWQGPTQGSLLGPNFPQSPAPFTPPPAQPLSLGQWQSGVENNQPSNPWTASAPQKPEPSGGFLGALENTLKNIATPLTVPYQAANALADRYTGTSQGERLQSNVSGNTAVGALTGGKVDLDKLPYGLGYLTDAALAPTTPIAAGLGPSNALLGSTFGGGLAKQFAGETAINLAGNLGAQAAASDTAAKIPYFGDQPAWLRGIEGGALGAVGVIGATSAAKSLSPDDFATSSPKSIYPDQGPFPRIGQEAQYPPSVASQMPQGGPFPQLAGAADDAAGQLNPARRSLLDALNEQRKFRESGQADEIIHQGRVQQNKGIGDAIANSEGKSFSEIGQAMSEGARTGEMLPRGAPLNLSEETLDELFKEAVSFNGGRNFDNKRAWTGLDKLQQGQRLQPAEIKALGEIYGDEVARAIRETNPQRIPTVAGLTDADMAKIAEQSKVDGKKVAVLEAQARRQHELADDLLKQSRMDPTNPRLKKAVDDARARAIAKENEADRLLSEKAEQWGARNRAATEQAGVKANRAEVDAALKRDKALAAEEAAVRKAAEDEWIKGLDFPSSDPYAERLGRYEASANRSLSASHDAAKKAAGEKAVDDWVRSLDFEKADDYQKFIASQEDQATHALRQQQDSARKVQLRASNKARINSSDEQMVTRAKDVVAKLDMPDTNKSLLIDTIEAGVKKQRVLLDGMGEDGPSILRKIYAATTGEVTDSYTSQLLTQRAFIQNALESQGMSSAAAKKVGKLLQDADIRMRFGDNVPEWVTKSIEQSKFDFNEGGAIKGLADISQELKNTQFGIGDLAVFGQQGAKLAATNAPQFVAGIVNRILNMAHIGADTGLEGLAKSTAYQLDGLARKSVAITDLTNDRTLVSRLGPVGRALDSKAIVPATKWLTDLQFDHILGKAREITYEGNLVLAKLVGEDITDPAVRLRAAEWANAASGAGKLAQQSGRKNAERAFLLSPSMRRAQIQQMGQVMKGLAGQQGLQGEIYAIATISSMAGALAAAKAINDRYGMDEFVWDPRKQGFGNITLPGGHVLNPFSQEQLVKAFARSLEVLGDGNLTEEDAAKIAKEWGKLGISSASPAIRPFLAQVGVGYDPGKGYAFGDLGEGKGFKGKLLDAAPIPPIGQQVLRGDVGKVQTPLDIFGVGNYPEGQYQTLDRKVKADPAFGGRGYSDLSPSEKQAAQEKYGKLDPFGPEGIRSQEVTTQLTTQQAESDTRRREGELTPEQWRKDYSDRKSERFIRNDEIYHATNFKPGKDTILNGYYAAIGQAERPDGTVDWDKVDAYRAGLDAPANKHIDDNTGLVKIDTPVVRQFEQAKTGIEGSGYFAKRKENWAEVSNIAPTWNALGSPVDPKDFESYDDWRQAALKAALALDGKTFEDIATVTKIEAWLDKQEPAKGMDYYSKQWTDEWAANNPKEAYEAWRYGYYNPRKEIKGWLASKFE